MPRTKNSQTRKPKANETVKFEFSFQMDGALFHNGPTKEAYLKLAEAIASFCDDLGEDVELGLSICGMRQLVMHALLDKMLKDRHEECAARHLLELREHFNKQARSGQLVDGDDDAPSLH